MDLHLPQELYATSDYVFDESDEHEDDVFYREIREQVLQLTVEDDDDDVDDEEICESKGSNAVAAKQGLNNKCVLLNRGYYNWPDKKDEDKQAPSWILNLWRNGNGTGVFIPQIAPSRGKYKPRKRKGRKGRSSKKVEEKQDSN